MPSACFTRRLGNPVASVPGADGRATGEDGGGKSTEPRCLRCPASLIRVKGGDGTPDRTQGDTGRRAARDSVCRGLCPSAYPIGRGGQRRSAPGHGGHPRGISGNPGASRGPAGRGKTSKLPLGDRRLRTTRGLQKLRPALLPGKGLARKGRSCEGGGQSWNA